MTGTCQICERVLKLRKNGTLHGHLIYYASGAKETCPGSGLAPRESINTGLISSPWPWYMRPWRWIRSKW